MTPYSAIAHNTQKLPTGSFKHVSLLVLSCEQITPDHDHNFSSQDRRILRELYLPILNELESALSLFIHDPSQTLAKLKSIQTELATQLRS